MPRGELMQGLRRTPPGIFWIRRSGFGWIGPAHERIIRTPRLGTLLRCRQGQPVGVDRIHPVDVGAQSLAVLPEAREEVADVVPALEVRVLRPDLARVVRDAELVRAVDHDQIGAGRQELVGDAVGVVPGECALACSLRAYWS